MTNKLPVWVKNAEGKYEVFPIHMLEQRNGKWGFEYDKVMGQGNTNPYWHLFLDYSFTNPTYDVQTHSTRGFVYFLGVKK